MNYGSDRSASCYKLIKCVERYADERRDGEKPADGESPRGILVGSIVGEIFVGHDGEHDEHESEERRGKDPHETEPGTESHAPHLLQVLAVLADAVEVGYGHALEQTHEQKSSRCCVVVKNLKYIHAAVGDHGQAASERD